MEWTSSEDEDQEQIQLKAIRPHRAVKFDLTETNREDLEAQRYHEPKQTNALQRNSWSSSTQRVLSSMPSRSIRFNQSTAFSRSTESRRRRPLSFVSTAHCTTDQDVFRRQPDCQYSVTQNEDLLNKLQGLSAAECVRVLREMPLSVLEKRQIRAWFVLWDAGQPLSANRVQCCHRFKAWFLKVLCGGCYGRVSQQKSIQLWHGVLKKISAHFGTGILSYFIFLRRLLHFNILLFLIAGLFLVIPQISNPFSSQYKPEATADLWMLTGMGILTDSVMFYGHYATNNTCQLEIKPCSDNYNIPLAYIFTIGTGMFITFVMLVYSISKSFGKSSRIFKTTGNLALKVFCSWDFKVSKRRSVKLQSVNICIQLKEMLSEISCKKQKRNLHSTFGWLSLHFLVWTICLFCIAICMLAVYHFHPYLEQDSKKKAVDLLKLPLVVSCISHLLPGFFDMLSRVEHYASPSTRIYVSIARNLLLKGCIFSALCYYWLKTISGKGQNTRECWETLVGQELYRLVLMDLLFAMSYIILAEFLWGLCIRNITLRRRKLEFDIARDVLELIYGQTLVWFGVLFSPLLPAVQIGKLVLLFYFKKTSLMMNFQPPRKHWRATQMSSFFIKLLFFPSFTGALACVIYAMWRVTPSLNCGPFSNLPSMLRLGKEWIKNLGESKPNMFWLSWAYNNLVDNPLFLFITAGLLLASIYIHMQVLDGQKRIIAKLQEQIDNEGEDKKFLIAKLQALNEAGAQN
ncbi:transmembrane channel-like protein 6 [Carassius gibelio]|uniref:transmembrane channel-like protein 6 n=1 Tax=Carassius gibelio TaxID=101364 RepID=UPI00227788DF|nr:transmembrane channel-like protein 6 [Carassius gibelio]XP_052408039.1 transmembrane channel-like protein 6 [Carassius gibelio]XP_052408041.1 transmembrane channel-like protein 6 [Carassius gibelio]XP_052408042.1 transmembrane channel-like protein 6 [Carassius gibelio]XP_052408043.1 transmembrane channel-like protein 6 [Carassius gibelio]